MSEPEKTAKRQRLIGWTYLAAGALNLSTHFSTQSAGFAIAAAFFFAASVVYFNRAKKASE